MSAGQVLNEPSGHLKRLRTHEAEDSNLLEGRQRKLPTNETYRDAVDRLVITYHHTANDRLEDSSYTH